MEKMCAEYLMLEGTVSHAESLSVYLTGMMMIQLVPLRPHSHLIVSMQDSNLQGTCVASCSVLSVTFWSRPLPTIAWTAAGLIWFIQARGERDKLILITSGKTSVKPPRFKSQFQHHSVSHVMTEVRTDISAKLNLNVNNWSVPVGHTDTFADNSLLLQECALYWVFSFSSLHVTYKTVNAAHTAVLIYHSINTLPK